MDKEKARKLDSILGNLSKDGELKEYNSSIDPEDLRLLESYGYVKVMGGSGEIRAYALNSEGVVFIEEGGFSKIVDDEKKLEKGEKSRSKYFRWELVIAIIAVLIALYEALK